MTTPLFFFLPFIIISIAEILHHSVTVLLIIYISCSVREVARYEGMLKA